MNSSSEAPSGATVLRDADATLLTELATPELRVGTWTRFGGTAVLGDAVTEQTLSVLAETTRSAARSQGYAVGWSEGRQAAARAATTAAALVAEEHRTAELQRDTEHRAAVDALMSAAAQVRETLAGLAARVDEQAATLAFDLATELVGHEVRTGSAADVVRRVLAAAPPETAATVRLHPDAISPATQDLTDRGLVVVADPSLQPGDAVIETDETAVDLRLTTALERIREALR